MQASHQPGGARQQLWAACRAATDLKTIDGLCRFQDGAATANNPSALALAEARMIWPDVPIDCLVSLGSGAVPTTRREKSMSAYLDTGSVLIEVRAAPCALQAASC